MKDVIIIGTGEQAKIVADIILCAGDRLIGFLAGDPKVRSFLDRPVLGKDTDLNRFRDYWLFLAIGNADSRERLAALADGVKWYTAIHPAAVISRLNTSVGEGSAVMANAVINPFARVGRHCIVNTGAIVEHDNVIEDFVHVSVGARLAGEVRVGRKTWIGVGATVRNGICICENCMIGAGAVVVRDITEPGTYVGVPAGPIEKKA